MKRVRLRGGVEGEENKRGEGKKRKPGGGGKGKEGRQEIDPECASRSPRGRGVVWVAEIRDEEKGMSQ